MLLSNNLVTSGSRVHEKTTSRNVETTRNWPAVTAKPEIITVFALALCPIDPEKNLSPKHNTPLKKMRDKKKKKKKKNIQSFAEDLTTAKSATNSKMAFVIIQYGT